MKGDVSSPCVNTEREELKTYRTGRFVASLVFLGLSVLVIGLAIGLVSSELFPYDVEVKDGVSALGVMLLLFLSVAVMMASIVLAFAFSLIGFLCGIVSLKSLPSDTVRIVAIISTVLNGMLHSFLLVIIVLVVIGML